jgi:hypothetical protein
MPSETRHLTKLVGVRYHPDDVDILKKAAERRGFSSVQEYLRDLSLRDAKAS